MLVLYIFILMFTNSINHLKKNIHSIFISRISIITLLLSILFAFNTLYFQSIGKGISVYSGLFQITVQSHLMEIILLIVGISILWGWPFVQVLHSQQLANDRASGVGSSQFSFNLNNLNSEKDVKASLAQAVTAKEYTEGQTEDSDKIQEQYSLIAIFSILGGSLLMSSLDLLSMYLSIELQSFALYILATLNKERLSATSAGLKYFLLGSLSSCFILLGIAIIYSYTGLTQFEAINTLISIPLSSTVTSFDLLSLGTQSSLSFAPHIISGNVEMLDINKAFTIGFVIIIIGFLFKISAAPFYQWAPDVYDGVPTIVTVWLTIVVKITILIFLLGLFEFWVPADSLTSLLLTVPEGMASINFYLNSLNLELGGLQMKNLLLLSSLLSLIVGTVAGLSQVKVKRLLAFSSISHVGFLLLALGIFTQKSIDSFIFYLLQYTITSLNIFLIVLAFGYFVRSKTNSYIYSKVPTYKNLEDDDQVLDLGATLNEKGKSTAFGKVPAKDTDINYLIELKGQLYNNPLLSVSIAICLFSMAGIPPLIGFFSKQFVLFSSIENGNNFLSIVAILVSVISASYYLRLIKITFFLTPPALKLLTLALPLARKEETSQTIPLLPSSGGKAHLQPGESSLNLTSSNWDAKGEKHIILSTVSNMHSYIISILTFIILFFFLDPSIILNGTQLISLTIFNL